MKFTKEKLLSLVKQNINEMSMEFFGPDRPSGDVEQKLQANDTPLSKVPLPKTNIAHQNFQELLASERYRQVVDNVRNYTNFNGVLNGQNGLTPLLMMMSNAHNQIIQIERNHREELEQLAVQIVKEEMGLSDDDFNFDAKIIGQDEFDTSDFNREQGREQNPQAVNVDDDDEGQEEMENIEPETIEIEEELYIDLAQLNLERAKRRLINSVIQGASKKGHYMYQLIPERLQQITGSDSLINLYGVMMSVNDANYWQLGDETIRGMGDSVAGKVKLNMPDGEGEEGEEESDGKPTIQARGVNFPVLVHELIKGVLETLGTHGQTGSYQSPQDVAMTKKVMELEDTLEKEMWDLRLGPAIWDRIRTSFPEEVLLENGKELQNYLFMNIFQLPAKEFLVLMREVISNSDTGKNLLSNMLEGIKKMLNNEEYEDALSQFNNEIEELSSQTDGETLKDELKNLGIDLSDLGDDEESDEDFLSQFK